MKEGESNFHQVNLERNILRDNVKELGLPPTPLEESEKKHRDFSVKSYGSFGAAKKELRSQKEAFDTQDFVINWELVQKELGQEKYDQLDDLENKSKALKKLLQAQAHRLREMNNNPKKTELYKTLIEAIVKSVDEKEIELQNLEKEYGEVSRIKDLLTYRSELFQEGHIAEVPSVQKYLSKIEEAMIEGKPMLLHGPTGTGKTSLAIRAAKVLTGKDPEMIYCNPQTKESNIFGKTGIAIDEKTEKQITKFDPAPLVRAMEQGSIVIFDEFTALPKAEMVMLKGIMNAKVGDRRSVTGDGEVTIAHGFQMIFTANLKSEKNPERQELPPEMANEFSQNNTEIQYQTQEESYDIMLARLMNADGSIELSEYDMNVTLKKLSEAVAEIQKTYTTGTTGDLGGKEELKKYVLNQRNIENILSRWKTGRVKGDVTDFVSFLEKQLVVTLTFRDFSLKDTELAAKILARHGLLPTVTASDIGLDSTSFSFVPPPKNAVQESSKIQRFALEEVAELDPFNVRKVHNEDVKALLSSVTKSAPLQKGFDNSPDSIKKLLASIGTPATLDESFEKGVISFDIDAVLQSKLKDITTALESYKSADKSSPSWSWYELKNIQYSPPNISSLDVLVLNHGKTTQQERDKLVEDMDKAGYRPLIFSELVALSIAKPELNKRNEILNTYQEYMLDGSLQAPYLDWNGVRRFLSADVVSGGWDDRYRFLFVRK